MNKLNFFILLPHNTRLEKEYINDTLPEFLKNSVKILVHFQEKLKNLKARLNNKLVYKFFYDGAYIKASEELLASLEVGNINDLKTFFIDFQNMAGKYIHPKNGIDYNQYVNFHIEPVEDIIKEVAERKLRFVTEEYFILDLMACLSAEPRPTNKILVIKDAHHEKDLPIMVELNFMKVVSDLDKWIIDQKYLKFSLEDKTRFSKTSDVVQGKSVYKEIATNRYWYLDNFHKNEYEVFDATRKHIGVADLDGNLDTSKKDEGRRF